MTTSIARQTMPPERLYQRHLISVDADHRMGEAGILAKEIMIDFTGGQKVTSVVAAMVTINRRVKTQYEQTNRPWNVAGYDIQMGSGETEGLGA